MAPEPGHDEHEIDAAAHAADVHDDHAPGEVHAPGEDHAGGDHAAHGNHDPLDPGHLLGHVQDSTFFEIPQALDPDGVRDGHLHLWQPINKTGEPVFTPRTGVPQIDDILLPVRLQFTKFMALELIAAVIIIGAFVWLASKVRGGGAPRGRLWNLLESVLLFIRDEVARPAIGKHDADKFLPFLWTLFFFILIGNLLGMVPWAGSYTGSFAVTTVLALATFLVVIATGMAKVGPVKYWTGQVPHMELPWVLSILIKPLIFVLEIFGLLVRHFVLAVRLMANIFAGHLVLATILAFIAATASSALYWGVMPVSILGAFALSILELFVAFLQAYIFVFLASLFIGSAAHPH
ncbi:MAG TPA: F0F1 ATP synthase subunit A [Pirellulaceae bacterium]|jgi:F-type H+-transporting ATPase subunit a|nr:F0F1 ATP synthase subunit A [Pirellulaceae bacterium]